MTLLTVTLTDSTGAYTANLNSGGPQGVSCGIEFSGNNPLILIPVPADPDLIFDQWRGRGNQPQNADG